MQRDIEILNRVHDLASRPRGSAPLDQDPRTSRQCPGGGGRADETQRLQLVPFGGGGCGGGRRDGAGGGGRFFNAFAMPWTNGNAARRNSANRGHFLATTGSSALQSR